MTLYQRVLSGNEKVLGKEHPETLKRVNGLAYVLLNQEKYEAAENLFRRAVGAVKRERWKKHT